MGGEKKKTQVKAENVGANAAAQESAKASALGAQLESTNRTINSNVYGETGSVPVTGQNVGNIATTGGYDPTRLSGLRGGVDLIGTTGAYDPAQLNNIQSNLNNTAMTGGYDPAQVNSTRSMISSSIGDQGYGREGYQNLADTGGYDATQKEQFLQHAIDPVAAAYSRTGDEQARRMALQGGYSPGFTSGMDMLNRHKVQDLSNANLSAEVSLDDVIRNNKLAGLGGLASTQSQINANRLQGAGLNANLEGNIAQNRIGANNQNIALQGNIAQNRITGTNQAIGLESNVAGGKVAGQDALQRYMDSGVSSLQQNDITQLQNRLQTGNLSMADAQLLTQLASQQKTTFDKIMQGIQVGGGLVSGVAGAFK